MAQLPAGSKPTATLVPTIRELCRQLDWPLRELDLVCVDVGPGSYTGLRVGLTCAKTLAFAAGAALATAGSLEIVAQNVPPNERCVEVAFDAARGQVFAGRFRSQVQAMNDPAAGWDRYPGPHPDIPAHETELNPPGSSLGRLDPQRHWSLTEPVRIAGAEEWAAGLDRSSLITGPALVRYRHLVSAEHRVADESLWWPDPKHVIELGVLQFLSSPLLSYWTLEPVYLRPSAAEERRSSF